jgi:hypothetical protein
MKSPSPRALLRLASLALAVGWLCGAIGFVRSQGVVQLTLPRKAAPPAAEHNLASYRWGPSLRASSYFREPSAHHHPLFLVDGRSDPSLVEKWASALGDRAPWVEISWREPRAISRVVVQHAGAHEPKPNLTRYSLYCLSDSAPATRLAVRGNRDAIASHALRCPRARGLRIEWPLAETDDVARVYEVEVWGQ